MRLSLFLMKISAIKYMILTADCKIEDGKFWFVVVLVEKVVAIVLFLVNATVLFFEGQKRNLPSAQQN